MTTSSTTKTYTLTVLYYELHLNKVVKNEEQNREKDIQIILWGSGMGFGGSTWVRSKNQGQTFDKWKGNVSPLGSKARFSRRSSQSTLAINLRKNCDIN